MKFRQLTEIILSCALLLLFVSIYAPNLNHSVNETVFYNPNVSSTNLDCFLTKWDTTKTTWVSSDEDQVRLPLVPNGTYNFFVQWGDGTNNTITMWNQSETTHMYSTSGIYLINITGTIQGWSFLYEDINYGSNYGMRDNLKLVEIQQWGCLRLGNSGSYFYKCENMRLTVTDTLNLTGTTTLHKMFYRCELMGLSGHMSNWNVSKITDMSYMFYQAYNFNVDISNWDVSQVTDMSFMFGDAFDFNRPIGIWNVSSVTDMSGMFYFAADFNRDIGNWDVSSVTNMSYMFYHARAMNQDIGSWNVSSITDMHNMFERTENFNQDIGDWDVSSVTDMSYMFYGSLEFNQDIGSWNVSAVTDMHDMFYITPDLNQNFSRWDVSSVTNMHGMFGGYNYNLSIGNWDVSRVIDMSYMFLGVDGFIGDIGNWNVSSVTNMQGMFSSVELFNKDIGDWDVSRVTDMGHMFNGAEKFNQDISKWNVSSVSGMIRMFYNALSFDQDLGAWDVSNVQHMSGMFEGATLSTGNYDSLLNGWSQLPLRVGVTFHGGNSQYGRQAKRNRKYIIEQFSWIITDGGPLHRIPGYSILILLGIIGISIFIVGKKYV